jgi:peroxiredoxin
VKQYDVAFPNLGGVEGYVASKRAVFVLDKGGVIRYKWVGPTPGVEPNYEELSQAVARLPK